MELLTGLSKAMHKLVSILFCTLIFFVTVQAQEKKYVYQDSTTIEKIVDEEVVTEDTLYIDTAVYNYPLAIPKDSIDAWKKLNAFNYIHNLDSLLKAKQELEKKNAITEESTPSGPSWLSLFFSSGIIQFLLWAIAIGFVLFLLYKLFLTEGAFRKKSKSVKSTLPQVEEEIINSESDFEVLIRHATQAANYRLAVRYQYLQTLHKLADKNFVTLANDKTNYQYVREISNQNYQQEFASLTLHYEYVWYGEFAIAEAVYKKIETGFVQFNNKL